MPAPITATVVTAPPLALDPEPAEHDPADALDHPRRRVRGYSSHSSRRTSERIARLLGEQRRALRVEERVRHQARPAASIAAIADSRAASISESEPAAK